MANGVIYLLGPAGYAELLTVSLYSLRRHFAGPVTIFATDAESLKIAERIAGSRTGPTSAVPFEPAAVRRHGPYCTKPLLTEHSPYDRTVLLDADTVVCGPIDPLFEAPLSVTRFSNWISTGRTMRGRIEQWLAVSEYARILAQAQLDEPTPAINTGVVAFHRGAPGLDLWRAMTLAGHACSFTDELAMQILYPTIPGCRLLDDRWNCSVRFGQTDRKEAAILHFHGRKHVRDRAGKALWLETMIPAMRDNFGGLASWFGNYDKAASGLREALHATR